MKGTGFSAVADGASAIRTVRTAMNGTTALKMRMLRMRWRVVRRPPKKVP
jgi:hypothetical protein